MRRLRLLFLLLVLVSPVLSQSDDEGRGVIRLPNTVGTEAEIVPTDCGGAFSCEALLRMMFPRGALFDPTTQGFIPGTAENNALIVDYLETSPYLVIFEMRDDATWSDGTPITAYDLFYSLILFYKQDVFWRDNIVSAWPLDDTHLQVAFRAPHCDSFRWMAFPVLPSVRFRADFPVWLQAYSETMPDRETFDQWQKRLDSTNLVESSLIRFENQRPPLYSSPFTLTDIRMTEYLRFLSADGALGVEFVDVEGRSEALEMLLNGELAYVDSPPSTTWASLRANRDVQTFSMLADETIGLRMNLRRRPNLNEREYVVEPHPIFGDVRVRQAVQLGINVPALIDSVYNGEATQVHGLLHPYSVGYDPAFMAPAYDPARAAELLYEAGWHLGVDGVRRCVGCLYAEEGSQLALTISSELKGVHVQQLFDEIAGQLAELGISISQDGFDGGAPFRELMEPFYDLHLFALPFDATYSDFFSGEGIYNAGQYDNMAVGVLLDTIQYPPDCDVSGRADALTDIQAWMAEDAVYIPLLSPTRFAVASPLVRNITPINGDFLWNLFAWEGWTP